MRGDPWQVLTGLTTLIKTTQRSNYSPGIYRRRWSIYSTMIIAGIVNVRLVSVKKGRIQMINDEYKEIREARTKAEINRLTAENKRLREALENIISIKPQEGELYNNNFINKLYTIAKQAYQFQGGNNG